MANEWYVQHGGKQHGPITSANLKKLAADGKITPATTVRMGSEGAWVAAARVQGLFSPAQLAAMPPIASTPSAAKKPVPKAPPKSATVPVAAPPITPPPPPVVQPLAPVTLPVARIPKAVPAETGSVTAKVLGAVAIILGTVALATCWLPFLGGLIGWTGIVVGTLGLVVGIAGLVVAAQNRGSGLMWNVGGASSSAVGLVLAVVLGVAFGLFASAPAPKPVIVAAMPERVVQPPPQEAPPPQQPEPEPPEPEWIDASQAIAQGDIRAQIASVGIEQVRLEGSDLSVMRAQRPQPMLKVKVAIENTSPGKIVEVAGWPGGGDLLGGLGSLLGAEATKAVQGATASASLTDNSGNNYKQTPSGMVFGGQVGIGQDNSVRPGAKKQVELIFPPPLETIEYLRLELPPSGFGGSDSLRFQIPRVMIGGMAAP